MRGRTLPRLPRYREGGILYRKAAGTDPRSATARARGSNTTNPVKVARVLRVLDEIDADQVTPPAALGPPTDRSAPSEYDGWVAWWPAPPDHAPASGPYLIPDPPTIAAPVQPSLDAPVLWEASAEVGSGVWSVEVQGVYVLCDWMPRTGKEVMSGHIELSTSAATAKVKPGLIDRLGIDARRWAFRRAADDSVWDIVSITDSYYRSEFIELLLERQGV